ncbi:hypothetical protein [Pseudoxanthomonas sp. JBR18]|uniref:hypothetical protein n=1 Tax=Pseudoxanthomonas sp. JBR18 TaxID=2969308 RepID=UPI00230666E2|nr:hypothetical protein [Pseudoxanthomonas sp. JBR18]WCE05903.1 hypothetical protein PJ250_08130 [Pseudoxanthomonas sp. JBR18]
MTNYAPAIAIFSSLFAGVIFSFWLGVSLTEEIIKQKNKKKFSEDLALSIIHKGKNLSLRQIQEIAETRGATQHDIQNNLKILLREILAQRNLSLQEHQSLIESLLKEMRDREPFDGLPNEVRIHLERLREGMSQTPDALEPLAIQIRELVALKSREHRMQKYYTVGGFALGIIGLVFAAYSYWVPLK